MRVNTTGVPLEKFRGWLREGKISYLNETPNKKTIACVRDLGDEGDEILSFLERVFGELQGVHVNERRNCCTAVFSGS